MTMPAWLNEVQAVATVAIGVGVGLISFQQLRIAARKLKLDLYDRRYRIYDTMRRYIVAAFKVDDENLPEVTLEAYARKAEARFLLDSQACNTSNNLLILSLPTIT